LIDAPKTRSFSVLVHLQRLPFSSYFVSGHFLAPDTSAFLLMLNFYWDYPPLLMLHLLLQIFTPMDTQLLIPSAMTLGDRRPLLRGVGFVNRTIICGLAML